ncbi:hypothetical protein LXL04_014422 [Taraxacum kok-saghyz]
MSFQLTGREGHIKTLVMEKAWIPWEEKVRQDTFFPADLLLLASTNPDSICYTETANLDGETNLKIRKALEKTWDYVTSEKASEFKGFKIEYLSICLKGCSLRNTEYIVGTVIFTGHETKVMMNAINVPSKRSTLERKLDKVIATLFGVLLCLCLIGA